MDTESRTAPVVVRNFDAIEIATGYKTYYLNRQRLETAIALIQLFPSYPVGTTCIQMFRDEYPGLNTTQSANYMGAAVECCKWNITP